MKFRKIKSALVAMLRSFALTPTLSYDFKVDNIYYSVISKSNLTCRVTSGNTKYSGNIKIPKQVTYNKRKFNVTEIAYSAFKGCSGLNSVIIPNSVTGIANDAFYGCSSLEKLYISDGSDVLNLGHKRYNSTTYGLFSDCPLKSVYLGRNMAYRYYTPPFKDKKELLNLTIGNSVTRIGSSSFKGCSGLISVSIPDSVTEIGDYAFNGCSSLISVTIGNSVTKIGRSAFYGCSALEGVTSLATTAPSVYEDTFSIATYLNAMVYVPIGALESYSFATCWKNFNIEENVDYGVEGIKADGNLV